MKQLNQKHNRGKYKSKLKDNIMIKTNVKNIHLFTRVCPTMFMNPRKYVQFTPDDHDRLDTEGVYQVLLKLLSSSLYLNKRTLKYILSKIKANAKRSLTSH